MTRTRLLRFFLGSLVCSAVALAQTSGQPAAANKPDRAAAYYHYAMGHLYAELAGAQGNRGDYLAKAIENYKLALKADPGAAFLAEELSDLYIQAGRLREAVLECEEALKKDPDDLNSRRVLGRIYTRLIGDSQQNRINEEMVKRAIEQYQKIAEKQPQDYDTWLMLGRLHKVAQNSVESEKAYEKALDLRPDSEEALVGLALVYADLGDNQRAGDMLRRVAEKNPSLRTLTMLAGTYEQMRDYKSAADTYRRALDFSPQNADLKRALAQNLLLAEQPEDSLKIYQELVQEDSKDYQSYLRISQIYRQQRKLDEARQALDKAKQLFPDNLEIRYNEVSQLESEGKTAEPIALLQDILASTEKKSYSASERSNRAIFIERLGLLQRSNEQHAEAIETFRKLPSLDPSLGPRAAAQISDTYRQAKEFAKAEQEAEAAFKKYPNDRMVVIVRATILADVGKGEEAAASVRKLLGGANDRETYLTLAQIYEKTRQFDRLGEAIDQAERLATTDEEKEAVFFMRGAMYEKMKRYEEAEAEFRKVLALNPDNSSALNYLGYMFADRNTRLAEAFDLISRALEHDPHNGAYLDSLGWVYYRMGKLKESEDYLLRAVQKVSRDPIVRDHLGDVYFRQGRLKEAIAQWETSLKEWKASAASELDPEEVAKVHKKLEGARIRLAKESGISPVAPQQR